MLKHFETTKTKQYEPSASRMRHTQSKNKSVWVHLTNQFTAITCNGLTRYAVSDVIISPRWHVREHNNKSINLK